MFSFLFRYIFVIYVIIFSAVYKSLQLLLYTPWMVCMRGMAKWYVRYLEHRFWKRFGVVEAGVGIYTLGV